MKIENTKRKRKKSVKTSKEEKKRIRLSLKRTLESKWELARWVTKHLEENETDLRDLLTDIKLAEEEELEKWKKMERFEKIARLRKENSEREKLTEKSIETKNPSTWEVRKENPKIKEVNKFR